MKTLTRLPVMIASFVTACSCGGSGDAGSATGPPAGPGPQPALPTTFTGMVVFVRVQGTENTLMAMNPDGSGIVSLGVRGLSPHVSPDGRKVVYATPSEGIALLDLSTGRETVLAPRLSVRPKWSPNGGKILFWSDRSGTKEIYTMNPDGSGVVRLTDGGDGYHEAHWSPDGSRIVFRRVTGDGGDIWTMNADGTGARELYAAPRMQSDPQWSPDGTRIAFVGMVPRAAGSGVTSEVFVMNGDGSNVARLTQRDSDDWGPAWSPDGSTIAFFGYHTGPDDPDLFTVSPNGGNVSVLLGGPTYDHGPSYGPRQ